MSYEHLPREDLLTALDVLEKESKIQKAQLAKAEARPLRAADRLVALGVEVDQLRQALRLEMATIKRVKAVMGEWPKEWPTVQAYNHEHHGYMGASMDHAENGEWLQECDVREAICKALDADQGEGDGT